MNLFLGPVAAPGEEDHEGGAEPAGDLADGERHGPLAQGQGEAEPEAGPPLGQAAPPGRHHRGIPGEGTQFPGNTPIKPLLQEKGNGERARLVEDLDDEIENLKANVAYLHENIVECQQNIVDMEQARDVLPRLLVLC